MRLKGAVEEVEVCEAVLSSLKAGAGRQAGRQVGRQVMILKMIYGFKTYRAYCCFDLS